MAAKAKKAAAKKSAAKKSAAKKAGAQRAVAKKEVRSSRRKTHQAGNVAKDSPEMKAQRSQTDSKKTGVRKTRKQRDVSNQGTPSRQAAKSPRRAKAKSAVRRMRKPSSATTTPAPADSKLLPNEPTTGGLA